MLEELESYDWECAFNEGGLDREDVASIIAMEEGENDGANWIMIGKLKDGRYFWLSAGCDYTGWD